MAAMTAARPVRRTQAERRSETRRRVLDAATSLAAVGGSRAVSLAAVGEAAGYSRGIVTHHFGSRAGLLEELIRHTQNFDVPATADTGLGRLAEVIEVYLGGLHERAPRSQAFLKLWTESAGSEPSLAPLFAERDAWFRDLIGQYLRDGIRDGSIDRGVDISVAAVALIGALRGTAMLLFSTAGDVSVAALAAQVAHGAVRSLAAR
jgi:AcrR family transcriptional regulator